MARGWTPSVVPHPWRKNVSTLSPNPRCCYVTFLIFFLSFFFFFFAFLSFRSLSFCTTSLFSSNLWIITKILQNVTYYDIGMKRKEKLGNNALHLQRIKLYMSAISNFNIKYRNFRFENGCCAHILWKEFPNRKFRFRAKILRLLAKNPYFEYLTSFLRLSTVWQVHLSIPACSNDVGHVTE